MKIILDEDEIQELHNLVQRIEKDMKKIKDYEEELNDFFCKLINYKKTPQGSKEGNKLFKRFVDYINNKDLKFEGCKVDRYGEPVENPDGSGNGWGKLLRIMGAYPKYPDEK